MRRFAAAILLVLAMAPAVVAAPEAAAPADDAHRQKLTEILARREFRAALRDPGLDPTLGIPEVRTPSFLRWTWDSFRRLFNRVIDWIERQLRSSHVPRKAGPTWIAATSAHAAWALAAGAAALLGIVLWRLGRGRTSGGATASEFVVHEGQALPDALSQPADTWARFAEEFSRKGEWRQALRALYLKLLVLLHERGAIRYERQRTNGDYAADLAAGPAGEAFSRLTAAFDLAWYGGRPFDAVAYRAALGWARAVDRATAPAAP